MQTLSPTVHTPDVTIQRNQSLYLKDNLFSQYDLTAGLWKPMLLNLQSDIGIMGTKGDRADVHLQLSSRSYLLKLSMAIPCCLAALKAYSVFICKDTQCSQSRQLFTAEELQCIFYWAMIFSNPCCQILSQFNYNSIKQLKLKQQFHSKNCNNFNVCHQYFLIIPMPSEWSWSLLWRLMESNHSLESSHWLALGVEFGPHHLRRAMWLLNQIIAS